MRQIAFLSLLLAIILMSCGSNYEYWDISKFQIDNTALEDQEEIILLYSSRGPDGNKDLEYYIHMVAVSQETGDTVNILTVAANGITMSDKDRVFNFFNQENVASHVTTNIVQMDMENLTDINHIDDLKDVEPKKITKVARDPAFDDIADNNFPTIIGVIGITTKN